MDYPPRNPDSKAGRRRRIGRGRAWAIAALIAAISHVPGLARAEPGEAEKQVARERYASAREKLQAKRYADALADFTVADDIMGAPTTGLGRAMAHERLGQLTQARDLATRVSRFPKDPSEPPEYTEARAAAAELITHLSQRIPSIAVRVKGPPKSTKVMIRVDDTTVPSAEGGLRVPANPGNHEIIVSAQGYVTERRVAAVAEAAELRLDIAMKPEPGRAPAAARRPEAPVAAPRWMWAVGGAGVAALAAGSVFAVDFAQAQSTINERCPETDEHDRLVCKVPSSLADVQELEARRNRDLALGIALGGAGALAVGISIAGFLTTADQGEKKPGIGSIEALWIPSGTSNVIMVQGEF